MHVATYGTYITTPEATEDHADVKIVTTVSNQSDKEQAITVTQRLIDDSGKEVARGKKGHLLIKAGNTADVEQIVPVASPRLWTLENPVMYTMETTVKVNNRVTDVYATPIGIRTIHFDKDKGFFLNGKHHKLKGVCLHQDARMFRSCRTGSFIRTPPGNLKRIWLQCHSLLSQPTFR